MAYRKETANVVMNPDSKVRHHLLEIISFPMPDGSMKTIFNSAERLQELGIYDDYKLTIEIPVKEHSRLHGTFRPDEWNQKIGGSLKGKRKSKEHRKRLSESRIGKHWKLVNGVRVYY